MIRRGGQYLYAVPVAAFVLILSGWLPIAARAQQGSSTPADSFMQRAATQLEMNRCAGTALQRADTALNEAYSDLRRKLDGAQKEKLKRSQRAWIRFRDLECAFRASGVEGGSIQPMIVNLCLATMTRERTGQLTAMSRCREGDLSCPSGGR